MRRQYKSSLSFPMIKSSSVERSIKERIDELLVDCKNEIDYKILKKHIPEKYLNNVVIAMLNSGNMKLKVSLSKSKFEGAKKRVKRKRLEASAEFFLIKIAQATYPGFDEKKIYDVKYISNFERSAPLWFQHEKTDSSSRINSRFKNPIKRGLSSLSKDEVSFHPMYKEIMHKELRRLHKAIAPVNYFPREKKFEFINVVSEVITIQFDHKNSKYFNVYVKK